jgi:hypothetical protein
MAWSAHQNVVGQCTIFDQQFQRVFCARARHRALAAGREQPCRAGGGLIEINLSPGAGFTWVL